MLFDFCGDNKAPQTCWNSSTRKMKRKIYLSRIFTELVLTKLFKTRENYFDHDLYDQIPICISFIASLASFVHIHVHGYTYCLDNKIKIKTFSSIQSKIIKFLKCLCHSVLTRRSPGLWVRLCGPSASPWSSWPPSSATPSYSGSFSVTLTMRSVTDHPSSCVCSPPRHVERHQLFPRQPDRGGPHDVHLQLHPLLHLHEGQVKHLIYRF